MSATSNFASPQIVSSSPNLAVADLTAGKIIPITVIPPNTDLQYIRVDYIVTGTATAGKITAGITAGIQTNGQG